MHLAYLIADLRRRANACMLAGRVPIPIRKGRNVSRSTSVPKIVCGLVRRLCFLLIGTHAIVAGAGVLEQPDGDTSSPIIRHAAALGDNLSLGNVPLLEYSTFLGGKDDDVAYAVAVDGEGNAYVAGGTSSASIGRDTAGVNKGRSDALVIKVNANGRSVAYAKQLGGRGWDSAYALTVDDEGGVYIVGTTLSDDFPTLSAYQPTLRGARNAFVTKLDRTGAISYSTYLGGTAQEIARAVVSDGHGGIYVAGETSSYDFPGIEDAPRLYGGGGVDGFVAHLDATGKLTAATYIGGSGDDKINTLVRGEDGALYIAGSTTTLDFGSSVNLGGGASGGVKAFMAKLSPSNLALEYLVKLGGSGNDLGLALAIDATGVIHIAGSTTSSDFPLVSPFQSRFGGQTDGFIASISPDGRRLLSSTYLGGEEIDYIYAAALDAKGSLYVTGETRSPDFPLKHNIPPVRPICTCGASAFITKLAPQLDKIIYSTTVSGSGWDYGYGIAVDAAERTYVVGNTNAHDFPTTRGSAEELMLGVADAFLIKIRRFDHEQLHEQ